SGTLTFTPVADAFGTATITVTVNDGQGLSNTVTRTSNVTLHAVNDAPTLDTPNQFTVNEDSPMRTVDLTGITSGSTNEASQPLSVSAISNNTALLRPTVSYSSPADTGMLTFTPVEDAFGAATITVTVNDGQGLNNSVTRT